MEKFSQLKLTSSSHSLLRVIKEILHDSHFSPHQRVTRLNIEHSRQFSLTHKLLLNPRPREDDEIYSNLVKLCFPMKVHLGDAVTCIIHSRHFCSWFVCERFLHEFSLKLWLSSSLILICWEFYYFANISETFSLSPNFVAKTILD